MASREKFRDEVTACLARDKGVAALMDCIAGHFPGLDVYREGDDLVLRDASRFLIVRRTGPQSFRTQTYVEAPSTNDIDQGGGRARDLDSLFDELVAFSEV
jgi:hypothetical protein